MRPEGERFFSIKLNAGCRNSQVRSYELAERGKNHALIVRSFILTRLHYVEIGIEIGSRVTSSSCRNGDGDEVSQEVIFF